VQDHAAFAAAIEEGYEIVALYLLDEGDECEWGMGGASKWWLHHALVDLGEQLEEVGGKLHVGIAGSSSNSNQSPPIPSQDTTKHSAVKNSTSAPSAVSNSISTTTTSTPTEPPPSGSVQSPFASLNFS